MPKILFFIESLTCGGAEKSLVSLLQSIDFSKYEVDLMMLVHGKVFQDFLPKQVNVIKFPRPKSFVLNFICRLVYGVKWRILSRQGRKRHNAEVLWPVMESSLGALDTEYDVAIAYQQGFPTYYVAKMVKAKKKLAWINIDLEGAGYRPSFGRPFYDCYDNIVAVSSRLYQRLNGSPFVDSSKLTTVYDILNVDLIRQMARQEGVVHPHPGISPSTVKIVTVGRLSAQKNYPLAVRTALELKKRGLDFIWTFVGEGSERPVIEEMVEKHMLKHEVKLAGLQVNPYPFINEADIYVHTASFEGYGLTIAEAKILGKPVVSTNFSVVNDQITHGVNGLIAEMDPDSLADNILRLLDDVKLRQSIIDAISAEQNTTAITEVAKFDALCSLP